MIDVEQYLPNDAALRGMCLKDGLWNVRYQAMAREILRLRAELKHRETRTETGRRGKRTIAKEKLYVEVLRHIQGLRPRFNIGITTGDDGNRANRWHHAYRHWLFQSAAPSRE